MRLGRLRRRRATPYVVLGLVLVVVGALGSAVAYGRLSGRVPVLVAARDMPMGHVVGVGDVRVVQVAGDAGVATVRAVDRSQVVGHLLRMPVGAGHLLAATDVGPPAWPPPGQAVVAVGLKSGAYPPELAAGARVAVVAVTAADASASGDADDTTGGVSLDQRPLGTVLTMTAAADGQASAVASLLMPVTAASEISAWTEVRLVEMPPGGTR